MPSRDSRQASGGGAVSPRPSPGLALSFDEFRQRIEAEGFRPEPAALQSMYEALPLLAALRERVHADGFDPSEEPAMLFQAEARS